MARFTQIDSQIRANRLILANRFRVPELNPFFRGAKNCESQVWGRSCESLARYEKININKWLYIYIYIYIGFFFANRFAQIDSRESPRFVLRIVGPSKFCDNLRQFMTTSGIFSVTFLTPFGFSRKKVHKSVWGSSGPSTSVAWQPDRQR